MKWINHSTVLENLTYNPFHQNFFYFRALQICWDCGGQKYRLAVATQLNVPQSQHYRFRFLSPQVTFGINNQLFHLNGSVQLKCTLLSSNHKSFCAELEVRISRNRIQTLINFNIPASKVTSSTKTSAYG